MDEPADTGAIWISARAAVAELAEVYHADMRDTFAEARKAAITGLIHNLTHRRCEARAKRWGVYFRRKSGKIIAVNSETHGCKIQAGFWRYCFEAPDGYHDWIAGEFYCGASLSASQTTSVMATAEGVEFDRRTLPVIGSTLPRSKAETARLGQVEPKRRGRTPFWKWEDAICAITAIANLPHGLPDGHGAQAEIGRMLAQWFRDNQDGEPASSEIGARAAKIMTAIDAHRK